MDARALYEWKTRSACFTAFTSLARRSELYPHEHGTGYHRHRADLSGSPCVVDAVLGGLKTLDANNQAILLYSDARSILKVPQS